MPKPLTDFLSLVRPKLPGCPEIILTDAIREAAIEFCERSRLIDGSIDIATIIGATSYAVDGNTARTSTTPGEELPPGVGPVVLEPIVYCPGFAFTQTTTSSITSVLDIDLSALFYAGRRIRITDTTTKYATVIAADYAVFPGNTELLLSMEDGATIVGNPTEVCLTSSTTAWVPIAADPFAGTAITAVTSGQIGSTVWWVAVGSAGKVATSNDRGVTWTLRTTGSTANLTDVGYNSDAQTFLAVGFGGAVLRSTDGITFADPGNLSLKPTTGNGKTFITYSTAEVKWMAYVQYKFDQSAYYTVSDSNTMVWSGAIDGHLGNAGELEYYTRNETGDDYIAFASDDGWFEWANLTDFSPVTKVFSLSSVVTVIKTVVIGGLDYFVIGLANGTILVYTWGATLVLTQTLPGAVRGISFSPQLNTIVVTGGNGSIGTITTTGTLSAQVLSVRPNGFSPLTDIFDVHYNATEQLFIAVASNGQICTSTTGV
jgi:hypothetical protein